MSTVTHTCLSKLGPTQAPLLHTCTLVVGDGTQKIEFKDGRAEVPEELCELVLRTGKVEIPGYLAGTITAAADGGDRLAQIQAQMAQLIAEAQGLTGQQPPLTINPGQVDLAAANMTIPPTVAAGADAEFAQAAERAAAQAAAVKAAGGRARRELTAQEREDALEAAREHLEAEGVEVPDIAKEFAPIEGREPMTADSQPRCQALKGDQTQCSNPARDGSACQLPKHREQLHG